MQQCAVRQVTPHTFLHEVSGVQYIFCEQALNEKAVSSVRGSGAGSGAPGCRGRLFLTHKRFCTQMGRMILNEQRLTTAARWSCQE